MRARDIPNLITIGRIVLVAPIAWALLNHNYPLALGLFAVAGISDGLGFGANTRIALINRRLEGSLALPAIQNLPLERGKVGLGVDVRV